MRVIIDTRETLPLVFQNGVQTERGTLPVGDYHCAYSDGSRPPIIFERKSIGDLYSTMTAGYLRFKSEMQDASRRGVQLVLLVEGTMADVYAGHRHSAFPGTGMVQKLYTLWFRYGLQPVFCASRADMAAYIVETYEAIGRCWFVEGRAKASRPDAVFGGQVVDFRTGRPVEMEGTQSSLGFPPPANANLDDLLNMYRQAEAKEAGWEADVAVLAMHVPGLVARIKAYEVAERQMSGEGLDTGPATV